MIYISIELSIWWQNRELLPTGQKGPKFGPKRHIPRYLDQPGGQIRKWPLSRKPLPEEQNGQIFGPKEHIYALVPENIMCKFY